MLRNKNAQGFTLIEIMIVVAIVAILGAIAIPAYGDYVTRGKVIDAVNNLQSMKSLLEQYYQDNRTYGDTASYTSPCTNVGTLTAGVKTFTLTCSASSSAFTVTATGKTTDGNTKGFTYHVDQTGTGYTDTLPARWGTAPAPPNNNCYITKKGTTC
jgi:type IV pilus assembly protein PilE